MNPDAPLKIIPIADAVSSIAEAKSFTFNIEKPTKAPYPLQFTQAAPTGEKRQAMNRYVIEREIPSVGTFERQQLREAAAKSNSVLAQLAPDIQWIESFVAENKTFCVYLAKNEDLIRKHAQNSGFPASKITLVKRTIDPTTAA